MTEETLIPTRNELHSFLLRWEQRNIKLRKKLFEEEGNTEDGELFDAGYDAAISFVLDLFQMTNKEFEEEFASLAEEEKIF